MRKYILYSLLALTIAVSSASCGISVDDNASENVESISTDESNSSQLTNCIIMMDSNQLHNGIEFKDNALLTKIQKYSDKVKSVYKTEEFESDIEFPAGMYMFVKVFDGDEILYDIYIPDISDEYVTINENSYHTNDGETAEFSKYITDFLAEEGYWG